MLRALTIITCFTLLFPIMRWSNVAAETAARPHNPETNVAADVIHPYPEHTATYKAKWRGTWIPITIHAERHLRYSDNDTGTLTFEADSSIAGLKEVSEFSWQNQQLQPHQ